MGGGAQVVRVLGNTWRHPHSKLHGHLPAARLSAGSLPTPPAISSKKAA